MCSWSWLKCLAGLVLHLVAPLAVGFAAVVATKVATHAYPRLWQDYSAVVVGVALLAFFLGWCLLADAINHLLGHCGSCGGCHHHSCHGCPHCHHGCP